MSLKLQIYYTSKNMWLQIPQISCPCTGFVFLESRGITALCWLDSGKDLWEHNSHII